MTENTVIFLSSVGLALLGWAVLLLIKVNNKVSCFSEWQRNHEETDKERHKENLIRFNNITDELRDLRIHRRGGGN